MIGSPHEEISSSKLLNKKCCTKLNLDGFNSIEECTKKKGKEKENRSNTLIRAIYVEANANPIIRIHRYHFPSTVIFFTQHHPPFMGQILMLGSITYKSLRQAVAFLRGYILLFKSSSTLLMHACKAFILHC
jgi:hypothetical protein